MAERLVEHQRSRIEMKRLLCTGCLQPETCGPDLPFWRQLQHKVSNPKVGGGGSCTDHSPGHSSSHLCSHPERSSMEKRIRKKEENMNDQALSLTRWSHPNGCLTWKPWLLDVEAEIPKHQQMSV